MRPLAIMDLEGCYLFIVLGWVFFGSDLKLRTLIPSLLFSFVLIVINTLSVIDHLSRISRDRTIIHEAITSHDP